MSDTPPSPYTPAGDGFVWMRPVVVRFGPGALPLAGEEVRRRGTAALLVTDAGLARHTDIVERARAHLSAQGVRVATFVDVPAHPDLATVRAGVARLRDEAAEVVVGLGGGRCMDVAKTIAASATNPAVLEAATWASASGMVIPALRPWRRAVPLVQVSTNSSTGSEVNSVASLRAGSGGAKRLLLHPVMYAQSAVVDPELRGGLSAQQTANGAFDTVGRLLGPYLADPVDRPAQDAITEGLLGVLYEHVPVLLEGGRRPIASLSAVAMAVMSSMMGWTDAGRHPFGYALWYIENALGSLHSIDKGAGLSALLPTYLRWLCDHSDRMPRLGRPNRLARLGRRVFGLRADSEPALAEVTAAHLVTTAEQWGLPTSLSALGLVPDHIPALVHETATVWLGEGQALAWMTAADVERFYTAALAPAAHRQLAEAGAQPAHHGTST